MQSPKLILHTMGKTESFSSKISKKARMPTLSTTIQHSTIRSSHSNQTKRGGKKRKRKGLQGIQIGKERKLSL